MPEKMVFHFKIQTCPLIRIMLYLVRPGGSLGLPTRSFMMTVFDGELAGKQMDTDLKAWEEIT